MRVLVACTVVLGALLLFASSGALMNSVRDFETEIITDTYSVSTAVGVTSANVSLSKTLYNQVLAYATPSSSLSTETPVVASYIDSNRVMLISGLSENVTRTIGVEYKTAGLTNYTGAAEGIKSLPMFLILIPIVLLIGSLLVLVFKR